MRSRLGARLWARPWWMVAAVVVLGVVGLSGRILWLHWKAGKEKAVAMCCRSNMKCSALSLLMYAQDNDGRFPPILPGQEDSWYIAAAGYPHSVGERWCVNDARTRQIRDLISGSNGNTLSFAERLQRIRQRVGAVSSYLMNPQLSGVRVEDIKQPYETVLLEEAAEFHKGYRVVGLADGSTKILEKGKSGGLKTRPY